jgi:4-hydroxy-2-oxoglutarate aldolase
MDKYLKGVFAPITTPFLRDESVDFAGLAANMHKYAKSGITGYLALGSNGENKSLTNDEKLEVLKVIVKNKGEDQVVMAGCIFESTFETIFYAKKMQEIGADYITLLPPSYFKKEMTDEVLYQYFSDVAEAVDTPCLVYNAPQFCGGTSLSVPLVKRLAEHRNIVGIKDSSSGNILDFLSAVKDKICVMAGSANFFLEALQNGATGGVISLANVFPELTNELYKKYLENDTEMTIQMNDRILMLNKSVSGSGGVAAVKYAMDLAGYVGGKPRKPLFELPETIKESIKQKLEAEKLI